MRLNRLLLSTLVTVSLLGSGVRASHKVIDSPDGAASYFQGTTTGSHADAEATVLYEDATSAIGRVAGSVYPDAVTMDNSSSAEGYWAGFLKGITFHAESDSGGADPQTFSISLFVHSVGGASVSSSDPGEASAEVTGVVIAGYIEAGGSMDDIVDGITADGGVSCPGLDGTSASYDEPANNANSGTFALTLAPGDPDYTAFASGNVGIDTLARTGNNTATINPSRVHGAVGVE